MIQIFFVTVVCLKTTRNSKDILNYVKFNCMKNKKNMSTIYYLLFILRFSCNLANLNFK